MKKKFTLLKIRKTEIFIYILVTTGENKFMQAHFIYYKIQGISYKSFRKIIEKFGIGPLKGTTCYT